MGLLDDERQANLVGHQEAMSRFLAAEHKQRMHHAWLIHGQDGIGKTVFALDCARHLLQGSDRTSAAGRQITAGTHPDLVIISRKIEDKKRRREIVLDDLKLIHTLLRHSSAMAAWRVIIIDQAHLLNRNAANALLKFLEEPPSKTLFLLTCPSPSAVIPTIRSRCRQLKLFALSDAETKEVLKRQGYADPELLALVAAAAGAPGTALRQHEKRDLTLNHLVEEMLSGRFVLDAEPLSSVGRDDDSFNMLCSLLGEALACHARELAAKGSLVSAGRVATAYSRLQTLRNETERFNLDKNQAVREAAILASVK